MPLAGKSSFVFAEKIAFFGTVFSQFDLVYFPAFHQDCRNGWRLCRLLSLHGQK